MILNKILENCAQKNSEKSALKMRMGFRTKTLSYKEVYELAKKVSLFLKANGIDKGDKVLVCAPNSPYWICIYWGCLLRGAIVVPLNIQTSQDVIQKIADQTEAKIIFKHLFFRYDLTSEIKQFFIEHLIDLIQDFNINDFKATEILQEDLVQIMYTSGTTGDPKGVMLSHHNLYSNLQTISQIIKVNVNDRILSILPLSHIYEQTIGFLLPYSKGVEIIYTHSYAVIRQLICENQITKMVAVPEFLQLMMGRIEAETQIKNKTKFLNKLRKISLKINNKYISRILFYPILKSLGKLDTIASGGSPLDPELEIKWLAMGIDILQGYGLTETSPIVCLNSPNDIKIGSVGKPMKGVQVKLADDKEVLVKGPNVFMGYYKNPEKTQEVFTADGWFKTGDLGEFDDQGYLFIKGRKKYMMKGPGGQNVYPEDIENELNKIPGVTDSCVLGFERPSGLEIHAVMLLDASKASDPQEIVLRVNNNLSTYQHITAWTVWHDMDFPRTPTRKIKKEEVRRFIESNQETNNQVINEKKSRLMQILSHITSVPISKINNNTKIVPDLQLDSLRRVELVAWIEEDLGSIIDETDITPKTTIEELEDIIQNKKSVKKNNKLRMWTRSKLLLPLKWLLQAITYIVTRFFVKINIEGLENLNNLELPAIFMPNHISYIDALILDFALPQKIRNKISFAAARDVLYDQYTIPSYFIEIAFNSFPIQRGEEENIKQGLDNIGQMLDSGYSVVLFPEGRMSKAGTLQDLRRGAGLIATEMDAWIVPVKITGTNDIVPYDNVFFTKRGSVTVKFGKPIKFKHTDSYALAIEEIHKAMQNL
ncbi:MAG: AMP-binding protein [Candidatus Babeliales bacterium]|nr:AMP-binding protein [Candidatus Babeliales bacterium]